jgi:hypothetical protein
MTNNNNNNKNTWRNRMGLQVPMEEQAEQLARRLQQASELLLEKLFAYLSQLPEEDDDDDYEEDHTDTPRRTTNNNNNTSCSGMTLPAAAVGWLSCQLFPMTNILEDDDDDEDVEEDAAQHTTSLWMGVNMRDRLSLLRFLLPRVTHLRLTRQAWPPELPKPSRKTKKTILRRRQPQPAEDEQQPPEELNCSTCSMSVNSALTTDDWNDLNHNHREAAPPTRQAFLEFMQTLQNHPRLDMRVFPKVQVLVLEGIPPTWIYNSTYSLQPSLQVLRISKACLYHVPSLLFPKPMVKRRTTQQQEQKVVEEEDEDPLAAPPPPPPPPPRSIVHNNYYPKLSHFKLDHCGIGELSRLPHSLSKLRHLQSLSLAHNDICTEATALKGLQQLSRLQSLDLSYNRLSSLNLANHYLGQLKVLKLSHNQLVTTRGGLDKLYSLEELWLDGNQISEVSMISGVSRLPQLRVLHLAGNPMPHQYYRKQVLSWCQQERRGSSPNELPILDGIPVTVKEWTLLQDESGVLVSATVVVVEQPTPTTTTTSNSNSRRRGAADTTATVAHNNKASTTTTTGSTTTSIISDSASTYNESSSSMMLLLAPSRNRRVTRKHARKPHKAKISSCCNNWQQQQQQQQQPKSDDNDTAVVDDETLPKLAEQQDPIVDDASSSNRKRAVFETRPQTEQGPADSFAKPVGSQSRLPKKRPYKNERQPQQQQQQLPSISFSVEDVLRSLQKPRRRQEEEDDWSPKKAAPKIISEDHHPASSSTTTTETSPTTASSADDSETCPTTTTSEPKPTMMATWKGTREDPEVDDLPDAPTTTLPIDHDTQKNQSSTLPPPPEMSTVPPKEWKAPSTKTDLSPVVDTRMASSSKPDHPEETTDSIVSWERKGASKGHQSAHTTILDDAESIMNASVATNGSKNTDPKEAKSPTDVDDNRSVASNGSKKKMSDLKSSPKRKKDDVKPMIMQPKPKVATIKLHTGATQQFDIFSADWDELVRVAAEGLIPNGKIRTPVAELEQHQQSKKQGGVFSMDAVDLLAPATTESTTRQQLDSTSTVATIPNNDQMSQASELGSGFRSMSMPEHIWSDDFSVPSSLGTNRDDFPKLNKFQLAEDNAVYDGPDACRDMNVIKNLELYFNTFVFPSSIQDLPLLSSNEEEAMNEDENWEMVVRQYPRIQLWPEDRRWLENSLSPMSQQIVDWASSNSRERFVRAWEEDVVPCGKPALRRLAPNRRSRLGFHGDQLFKNTGPEPYAECRRVILCLSSSAFYIVLREDSVTSKYQQQGKKKRFPVPVSDDALFGDAPWPHSVVRHSFQELQAITIGFEFQRLSLRFSNPAIRKTDPFVYMLLTSNKKETVGVLQEIQRLAKEANEHVTDLVSDSTAVAIENDSQVVFDALAVAVAPDLVGTILHYQLVQQRWKSGGERRGTVRRVCIVTDTKIFLLDEDYAADGHKALESNSGKLDNVSYRIVDEATLKQVAEVQAAGADPTAITIIINPLSRLSRTHRWRLLCRDSSGAERLVDDVRKALGQIEE